ncbi:MAG: c-type cytochrome [Deltaproteobacteria bacterium]|nr:c-type cytochrome [Deltaproteobacteria bacterium]
MTFDHWKDRLRARYQELKQQGKPFFPFTVFKDSLAVLIVFCAIVYLAVTVGADLEEIADPTATTYNPRPEWYFLFLFQALKFFPGKLEPFAAVVVPTFVIIFLLLLPFIDRGPKRHPIDRPILTALGIIAVGGFGALTYLGYKSPLLNPTIHQHPVVAEGKRLYQELRCSYCHSVQGRGGVAGPDLTTVGAKRDREWLIRHFLNPQQATPGSIMPRMHLLPEEAEALTAYMQTLGGEGPFTPEAPTLFAQQCTSCHAIDGKGGDIGPDLSAVRTYRDKGYVYSYIEDPNAMNPSAMMPGFKETLTAAQIEDLARYLLSTQRGR